MNKEIAEQWALELESGKWKQGKYYLNADGEMCCLGVLCEMAYADGVSPRTKPGKMFRYGSAEVIATAPSEVVEWSGLNTETGIYSVVDSLVGDNDSGKTFAEIAQIIRANTDNL